MNSGCPRPPAQARRWCFIRQGLVEGQVAPGHHVAGAGRALEHQHFLSRIASAHVQRFIHDGLERQFLATTHLVVGRDDRHSTTVDDAFCTALAEKPPKTTLWMAPIRAQACMAITPSSVMGMYTSTRSPFWMPCAFSALANWLTRASNSL